MRRKRIARTLKPARLAPHPMLRFYGYKNCSTCRDAAAWLRSRSIPFKEIAIRETPPTVPELKAMLKSRDGRLTRLFNTSGLDYRALGLKEKLPTLPLDEALLLLSTRGNLVKRPFVIDEKQGVFLLGFRIPEWEAVLG